jgi:hypothetical protein
MLRLAAVPLVALAIATPTPARPGPAAPPEGRIVSDEGRTEILGRPLRAGDTIELPEGYLRVEEDGPDDGAVGSFSVVAAESFAAASPAPAAAAAADGAPRPAAPPPPAAAARDCSAERGRYLAELWRASGIEVEHPEAILEGLDSGGGAQAGFYWLALATDPFRPLAWSSDLRDRAAALARCVRGN